MPIQPPCGENANGLSVRPRQWPETDLAPLVAESAIQIKVRQSRLPAVDSHLLAASQRLEDLFRGVERAHLVVDEHGQVGPGVERVAPQMSREIEYDPNRI